MWIAVTERWKNGEEIVSSKNIRDVIVSDYFHDYIDDKVTLSGQVGDALRSGKD